MKQTLALVWHSARRASVLLAAAAGVLALVQVAFALAANGMYESGTFAGVAALLPSFIRQMFGDVLAGFLSYTGMVSFGYFHPIIIAALAGHVVAAATEPVADIESRFLDLVLARPIRRAVIVARSALLVVLAPAAIIGVMMTTTLLSLRGVASPGAPVPGAPLVATLGVNLWAVLVCCGGASMAVGACCRRRSTAVGVVAPVLLALFVADYLARVWKPAGVIAPFSPFHYYDAMSIVMGTGGFPAAHVAALVAAGLAGMALAFVLFSRRDL